MGSTVLVAPFAALQWVNRRALHEDFPVLLFTFMSVHALLIVLLAGPALGQLRRAGSLRTLRIAHWAGLALSVALVAAYVDVVADQMPCFLGVPTCD